MSRIGKLPIQLPEKTQARIEHNFIVISGPKGEIKDKIAKGVNVEIKDNNIEVSINNVKDKKKKALWGTTRSIINNMVLGVTSGFEKKLEINGVGYRAAASGGKVILNVGFSHPVDFNLPAGVSAQVEGNIITIKGTEKQKVGEIAAQIRNIKKPEPYKGKGIKYVGEVIKRKEGKTAAK
jgi:large subunit ribosomal protein L6